MENLLLSDEVCPLCEVRFKAGQTYVEVRALDGRIRRVCEYCHLEGMHTTERNWYIYEQKRKAYDRGDEARIAELKRLDAWQQALTRDERAERLAHGGH
jgi:hypothetical protein